MLYEELRNYLVQATDPGTVEHFDNCVELFDDFNVEGYMDTFDALIGEYSSQGETALIDVIKQQMRESLNSLLLSHGVILNDDAMDSEIYEICRGIYKIQYSKEKAAIALVLESNQSAQECFAELMVLATPFSMIKTLSLIQWIDDGFIDTAKRFFLELLETTIVPEETVHQQFLDYDHYKKLNNVPLWTDRFFQNAGVVGLPFMVYLNSYLTQHSEMLSSIEHDRSLRTGDRIKVVAMDFVAMACLSEELVGSAKNLAEEYSDKVFTDPTLATPFVMEVTQLMLEFHRE